MEMATTTELLGLLQELGYSRYRTAEQLNVSICRSSFRAADKSTCGGPEQKIFFLWGQQQLWAFFYLIFGPLKAKGNGSEACES